ncbi:MAG: 3-hydroxyacyl-CoA dehydrogenase [Nitrospirota bacterium]
MMYIYKAAVIGAGTMGSQIAQVISYSGLPVILKDIDETAVNKGIGSIRKIYQARVDKGKMTLAEMEQKMALISVTTGYEGFSDVDIVIEAAIEDMEVKKKIFSELDSVTPQHAILATNTSSLSISAIGAATRRPEKVIGIHFFNPAYAMKLVEVIPGLATSSETIDDIVAFAEGLRKIPIKVRETAGFLVNRLLMPYLNEAAFVLQEGSSTVREVDASMVSFGMPMGPFALLDMIGIDVAARVADILYDSYGPRIQPASILYEMARVGYLGTKTGKGFYDYTEGEDNHLDPIIKRLQVEKGAKKSSYSANRLLLAMINEAVMVLQEGISSVSDIDIAMVTGTGFPQDKGGPLHYADHIRIDRVLEELQQYKNELGHRFWPAPMLKRMVGAGFLGVKSGRGFFVY